MRNFLAPQTTQVMRTATRLFFIRTHHGAAGTMAPGQQLSDSAGQNARLWSPRHPHPGG